MAKSADAFRTISEVADWLGSPAHVLRFWESKFSQVKPVKRAGGRRYYRPADMLLLGGIKKLLHDDGMTIKGVQKILREQGVKHVSSLSQPLDFEAFDTIEGSVTEAPASDQPTTSEPATVLTFQRSESRPEPAPPAERAASETAPDIHPEAPRFEESASLESETIEPSDSDEVPESNPAPAERTPVSEEASPSTLLDEAEPVSEVEAPTEDQARPAEELPAFLHNPTFPSATPEADTPSPTLRPAQIDLPPDPADDELDAPQGILSAIAARNGRPLTSTARADMSALMARLSGLHNRQQPARSE